jgi:REP element-mobilizing transposase RayT
MTVLGSSMQMTPLPGTRGGKLWQPRFFDRVLRTVKEYNEKVEYIHLNPVRAGLVSRPEDWSHPAGSSRNQYAGLSAE